MGPQVCGGVYIDTPVCAGGYSVVATTGAYARRGARAGVNAVHKYEMTWHEHAGVARRRRTAPGRTRGSAPCGMNAVLCSMWDAADRCHSNSLKHTSTTINQPATRPNRDPTAATQPPPSRTRISVSQAPSISKCCA